MTVPDPSEKTEVQLTTLDSNYLGARRRIASQRFFLQSVIKGYHMAKLDRLDLYEIWSRSPTGSFLEYGLEVQRRSREEAFKEAEHLLRSSKYISKEVVDAFVELTKE